MARLHKWLRYEDIDASSILAQSTTNKGTEVRTVWYKPTLEDPETNDWGDKGTMVGYYAPESQYDDDPLIDHKGHKMDRTTANLIGSKTRDGYHMPVIDLDIPVKLYPSSTHGHGHLYIDKKLTHEQYQELLMVMHKVGLVEAGIVNAFVDTGMTQVRPPWDRGKKNPAVSSGGCWSHIASMFNVFMSNPYDNVLCGDLDKAYPDGWDPAADCSGMVGGLDYAVNRMERMFWSMDQVAEWCDRYVPYDEDEDFMSFGDIVREAKGVVGDQPYGVKIMKVMLSILSHEYELLGPDVIEFDDSFVGKLKSFGKYVLDKEKSDVDKVPLP